MLERVVAVVLAAGESSRLGRAKALVECDGKALVSLQVTRLLEFGIETIVVTRSELHQQLAAVLADADCSIVVPADASKRTGNLKAGLFAAGEVAGLLVVPVDRPGWSTSTLERLLRTAESCCPESGGRGAHPLLIRGRDITTLAEAEDDAALNRLFTPTRITVEDAFLHLNVDTEEDLAQLQLCCDWLASGER